jgi:hypothetical protein
MIRLPQRSVTRFFIPLIDVLTLLFCTFLLLPMIHSVGEGAAGEDAAALRERLRRVELELERARRGAPETPAQLRDELERLRQEKTKALQDRLAVRVLEIDPADGRLFYRDQDQRVAVRSQAEARELIDRDRRRLGDDRRELYYLILYPRDPASRFPHRAQQEQYERWFEGVAHGFDVPGSAPGRGEKP